MSYHILYIPEIPFNSTGKERDRETGFSYFGARYYDSDLTGLFLSVDPMSDKYPSLSPYAYCAWSPVKLVDPSGCIIDSVSVPSKIWNMVNPNHDCYNSEFAAVFDQLSKDHTTIFSFSEWEEAEIKKESIVRGRISLIESKKDQPDRICIGFFWGEEGVAIAPERYVLEEVYHAKRFLDGEFGFGRSCSGGDWGLMGFDMYDEEEAHKWADKVSGSPNSWTQEAIDYYNKNRHLPNSRRNVTDHYMNHDGGIKTSPPEYDAYGVYKDVGYRTMRRPKN